MGFTQVFMLLLVFTVSHFIAQSQSRGSILKRSSLEPNNDNSYWVSPSGHFAFGFYPEGKGFAVGIWLRTTILDNITVVWTANQKNPLVSSDSMIQFTDDGRLILQQNQHNQTTNITEKSGGVSASMLDSGNFVIYDNHSRVIWQSFDYPTDTFLGGQKPSDKTQITSSRSIYDHSRGRFQIILTKWGIAALPLDHAGARELIYWGSGPKTGYSYLYLSPDGVLQVNSDSQNEILARNASYSNKTAIYRATLDADGILRLYMHRFGTEGSSNVTVLWSALDNRCQVKGYCGFNSYCANGSTSADCICFPGYDFIDPRNKYMGCNITLIDKLGCNRKEKNVYDINVLENSKLGGLPYALMSLKKEACKELCLEDCYCAAAYYKNGSCNKLKLPLMFGSKDPNESGTVFIKSFFDRPSPIVPQDGMEKSPIKKKLITILTASLGSVTLVCLLVAICSYLVYRFRVNKYRKLPANSNVGLTREFTLQSFSYKELWLATDGFKEKFGGGRFGSIYKGSIPDCQKIVAVKQLESPEEEEEKKFRAEMAIVRQTHHKNVVRLLGFCFEGAKKLLVYEYMSRGTLADLLFNVEKRPPWNERVKISLDVAKGIYYLHDECEVQIIHSNIKPKNILVDEFGTAKLSNFGFASILMPNQIETISGAQGTGGYRAPERQVNDFVTAKSDIYSYGVVLLEIICCRSNIEVNVPTADEILLSTWVYKCFAAGELNQLVQDEEVDSGSLERMVKIGLLCVQDDQRLRPPMKSVILMLEGTMNVPSPPCPDTLPAI